MPSSRRQFVQSALATSVAASLPRAKAEPAKTPTRPNILLLFPDQWRFDWMSTNSAVPIRTPNIDRLAKIGTRFENAVVASPLCAPSRACLASGLEYERCRVPSNGADYPLDLKTFYTRLRDDGYTTLACGKMDLAKKADFWGIDGKWRVHEWGFTDAINNAGKQDQISSYHKAGNKIVDPYLTFLNGRSLLQEHLADYSRRKDYAATFPTPLPDDAYCDNWLAGNGFQLLAAAPKDKPWFLQVNWTGPHNPEDITARMEKTVRGRNMPAVNGEDEFGAPVNQLIRQNYTAMCENVDRGVGEYLDYIEKTGQMENTLIIFSSDHGEMLGDHGRWGKQVPYHPSASVPMIIAGPGVKRGVSNKALVSSIDLTATILDYGKVSASGLDGRTLRPVLEGRTQQHRNVLYSGLFAWRMVYDGRYKVITNFDPELEEKKGKGVGSDRRHNNQGKPPLVFDLQADPFERTDLSATMPPTAQALLARLQAGGYSA
jgi:arylsulfatase